MGCAVGMEGTKGMGEGIWAIAVSGTSKGHGCHAGVTAYDKVNCMAGVEDVVTHMDNN